MKSFSILVYFFLFFFVFLLPLHAEPVLPHLFSDHMVFQREAAIRTRGSADPEESFDRRVGRAYIEPNC